MNPKPKSDLKPEPGPKKPENQVGSKNVSVIARNEQLVADKS